MKNNLEARPQISVIIPVYNSQGSLRELMQRIDTTLSAFKYEAILVDDGSKDSSWNVLQELKSLYGKKIIAIKLSRNFGQHNAILCGMNYCEGNFVVTMDDDLQHPPEEMLKLIEKQKETDADLVYGIYTRQHNDMIRSSGSKFIRNTSKVSGRLGEGSSYRLINRNIVKKMAESHQHHFLFIDEIIQWYTADIALVKVEHHARKHGKSTYTRARLFRMYFDILTNYSASPLKVMTWTGFLFSMIFAVIGLFMLYRKLIDKISEPGYASLIVSILFSASLIMFCLGILGQYMYKIYQLQNRKPVFSIKQIL